MPSRTQISLTLATLCAIDIIGENPAEVIRVQEIESPAILIGYGISESGQPLVEAFRQIHPSFFYLSKSRITSLLATRQLDGDLGAREVLGQAILILLEQGRGVILDQEAAEALGDPEIDMFHQAFNVPVRYLFSAL